jgi:hypothetical protein
MIHFIRGVLAEHIRDSAKADFFTEQYSIVCQQEIHCELFFILISIFVDLA